MRNVRRFGICWSVGALLLAGAAPAVAGPKDAVHVLTLEGALAGGKALTLYLPFGKSDAWAIVPPLVDVPHRVDAKGIAMERGRVTGELAVEIHHVPHRFAIDAAVEDGKLTGAFEGSYAPVGVKAVGGKVAGALQGRADASRPMQVALVVPSMYSAGHIRHPRLAFGLRDDKITGGTFTSGVDGRRGFIGRMDGGEVSLRGGKITGAVRATVTDGDALHGAYVFRIDGRVLANFITGTHTARTGERNWGQFGFHGTIQSTGPGRTGPGDGVYVLELADAIEGDKPLTIYLDYRGGAFAAGLGRGANTVSHDVGAAGLKLDGQQLRGKVAVTIRPDTYFPMGGQPVACEFTVDAELDGTAVAGRYAGRYGLPETVRGKVAGEVRSRADVLAERKRRDRDEGAGWPCWRGPGGSGVGVECGEELVDDLAGAMLVWKNEVPGLPSSFNRSEPGVAGGFSDLVVAGGRVYLYFYQPGGTQIDPDVLAQAKKRFDPATAKAMATLRADDVVLCLDATTGRELWRTVYPAKGLNQSCEGFPKAQHGPQCVPCIADGKVYTIGSAGRVYGLDANSGQKLWDNVIGPIHEQVEASLAAGKRCGKRGLFDSAPTVAAGVVVCNDHSPPDAPRGNRRLCGIAGFDGKTGKKLWAIPQCISDMGNSPVRWRHKSKEYVIVAVRDRALCIDPRTGRIAWEIKGPAHGSGTPAVWDDYLVLNGTTSSHGPKKVTPDQVGLTAYRISEKGATKLWSLPAKDYQLCNQTSVIIYNGHVYADFGYGRGVQCIVLQTGQVVGGMKAHLGYGPVAGDGRIFFTNQSTRSAPLKWSTAHPSDLRTLPDHKELRQSAYISPTYVAGRLYLRDSHVIRCYDLRKRLRE